MMLTAEQKQNITAWYDAHEDQLIADLTELCSYDSERRDPLPGMPFGKEAADCLAAAEKMLEGYGFRVKNYENYVLTADMGPEDRGLDILAHLDVVPVSNGWTVTDPFTCKIVDGKIYGRGTCDDKGPALAALYAMRAIKELGLPVSTGIRLILGSDEECGSSDLRYYFQKESSAPNSFSPDAEFPLINIEKARLGGGFSCSVVPAEKLPRVTSVSSGLKLNIVPDYATAKIEGLSVEELSAAYEALSMKDKDTLEISYVEEGSEVAVTMHGRTAHASTPQMGVNALTALLTYLSVLPLSDEKLHAQIRGVSAMFPQGDFYGEACGAAVEDPEAGKSTYSLNMFQLQGDHMEGLIDCRASLAATDENTTDVLAAGFSKLDLTAVPSRLSPAHYVPAESEIVKKLLSAWTEVTGKTGKPIAIGGGTYVHHIENGVAFGCGELGVDTHMHGDDEFMELSQIRMSYEVFVRAILNVCQ